ncbi:Motile sperm domain-containing protein 2 [Halotydeus destructor]|nr:Motile sperm domain-containing protein 2 [Halotydeus destructor]
MSFLLNLWHGYTSDKGPSSSNGPSSSPCDQTCQQVRDKVLRDYGNHRDQYDERDIQLFVNSGNGYIRRYLERRDNDVDRTFDMLRSALKWRKESEVSAFDELSFPGEFYAIGALFQYNVDRSGNALLIVRTKTYKNIPEVREGLEKFTVFHMFRAHERGYCDQDPARGWTFLFDMTGISLLHYDSAPQLTWLVNTLVAYFPMGLRKVIIYNVPFFFRPFVALVMTIIPKEWRYLVTVANGSDLFNHVAPDCLPDFMGGTCDPGLPPGAARGATCGRNGPRKVWHEPGPSGTYSCPF